MKHEPLRVDSEAPPSVSLAEIVGAFSYALDITEGQPAGHATRCCWIGSHIGKQLEIAGLRRFAGEAGHVATPISTPQSSTSASVIELRPPDRN